MSLITELVKEFLKIFDNLRTRILQTRCNDEKVAGS